MLEVLTFQKAEQDTIADYTAKYQQALQGVLLEENLRNRGDSYRSGEIKMGAPAGMSNHSSHFPIVCSSISLKVFKTFKQAGDTFKMALYYASATLGTGTTAYTTTGEVTGTNYTAGGETLTSVDPVISNNKAVFDFADQDFTTVTLVDVAGALIYNSSQSNAAVAVLKFASLISATAQTLTVTFPGATSTSAIIRLRQV